MGRRLTLTTFRIRKQDQTGRQVPPEFNMTTSAPATARASDLARTACRHNREVGISRRRCAACGAGKPWRPSARTPGTPEDYRRLGHPGPPRDLIGPDPVTGQQHDPGPLGQPGPDRGRPHPRSQHLTIPATEPSHSMP